MMIKALLKKYKKALFLFLPLVFLFIAILNHFCRGLFYYGYVDPEYLHLLNGLNMAIFNLAVEYIYHPGTLIQYYYAISAHLVNLSQSGGGLIINAMKDPESFVHGANILMNLITSMVFVLAGLKVYKYTGNVWYALLIQLTPFANYSFLMISGRLIPEAALIAPLVLLFILIIKYTNDPNPESNKKFYLWTFSIVGGLGIAGKFLYVPFLLIPFFMFPRSWWIRYFAYTTLSVVVIAFPVFVNLGKSWNWLSNMFLHSGKWGSGEAEIYDLGAASNHWNLLWSKDPSFFILIGLAVVSSLMLLILRKTKENMLLRNKIYTLTGVSAMLTVSVLMVTKHFTMHYYYPTLLFKTLLIYQLFDLISAFAKTLTVKKAAPVIAFGIAMVFAGIQIPEFKVNANYLKLKAAEKKENIQMISRFISEDDTVIITHHYSGSPFVTSGLTDASLLSGSLKSTFLKPLRKLYPNHYFYFNWTSEFYHWDKFARAEGFIDPGKPVFIFIGRDKAKNLEKITGRIKQDFPNYQTELTLLAELDESQEFLYRFELLETDARE